MNAYPGLMTALEVHAMRTATHALGVQGSLVDDIHQEAALKLWAAGLRGAGMAYRVAACTAVDMLRGVQGKSGRKALEAMAEDHDEAGPDDTASHAQVREALRSLSPADAHLAELLAEGDGAAAGRALGVSTSYVWQRKGQLREALARFVG